MFSELKENLQGIITSIGDHGELIAGTITNQNELIEAQEKSEQQNLISAIDGISSVLTSGHNDLSNAISTSLDNTNQAILVIKTNVNKIFWISVQYNSFQTSGEKSKSAIEVLNTALVSTLKGGHQQVCLQFGKFCKF